MPKVAVVVPTYNERDNLGVLVDQLTALDNVALTIFSREGKIANPVALAASDEVRASVAQAIDDLRLVGGLELAARDVAGGIDRAIAVKRHSRP